MNMTCAITRTPIWSGQDARVIFLRKSVSEISNPAGPTSVTDNWAPISFPIPMQFEDYSDFYPRDENDWRVKRFLEELSEFWMEDGNEEPTLEEVFSEVSKGALILPDNHPLHRSHASKDGAAVGIMAMHEKAYQVMVKSQYSPFMPDKKKTPAQLAEEVRAYFLQRVELKPFEQVCDPVSSYADFWFSTASSGGSVRVHGQIGPTPASIMWIITTRVRNGADIDDPSLKKMIEAAAEMMVLQTNMNAMAIEYAPQIRASDNFSLDLMKEINTLATSIYEDDNFEEEFDPLNPNL